MSKSCWVTCLTAGVGWGTPPCGESFTVW